MFLIFILQSEAIYNNDQYVDETLEVISKCGFNVVRMWAFLDNDPEKGLQRAPGRGVVTSSSSRLVQYTVLCQKTTPDAPCALVF